jgi:hypothetical protein
MLREDIGETLFYFESVDYKKSPFEISSRESNFA